MRILFVSSEYPPQTGHGGIGTYTRAAAQALSARGHALDVIALSETGKPYDHADGAVRVFRIGPGNYPLPQLPLFFRFRRFCRDYFPHSLIRLAWARSAASKFEALSRETPYDVVEAAECGAEAYHLKPEGKTRLIVRLHTPWVMAAALDRIDQGYWDLKLTGWMERAGALRAHAVSSPTVDLARRLEKRWGLKSVECYPNPLDAGAFQPKTENGDYIIYTGRVEYRKGVHLLIGALARLRARGESIPLKIVGAPFGNVRGQGSYGDQIASMIKTSGLDGQVEWIRGVPRPEVLQALRGARLAVFPSLWENFPYACLEAMGHGLPVLAARCGGYPEMMSHGESGWFFDAGSEVSLAENLSRLLSDAPLRDRLGRGARERAASEFPSEKIGARAEAFYDRVLHG